MRNLQDYIVGATSFIGNMVIPMLFSIALLFFVWNTFKFFILDASNADAKDNARRMAIYGIGAFVLLVSLWGIVNLIIGGLGLGRNNTPIQSDYFNQTGGSQPRSQGGNNTSGFQR